MVPLPQETDHSWVDGSDDLTLSRLRLAVAVGLARLAGWVSRLVGWGGSSLPGQVARAIDPLALRHLTAGLRRGVVLVTGTNGKTTTVALAQHLLRRSGWDVIHNRTGANLVLGLTASLAQAGGRNVVPHADLALLETDEASVPRAAAEIRPRGLVVTNFFRDQLDRYGELSHTVELVGRGLGALAEDGWAILNADDPNVARLGSGLGRIVYYGVDREAFATQAGLETGDARNCPFCGRPLIYTFRLYAHVGHYRCEGCGWSRPEPEVAVEYWDPGSKQLRVRFGAAGASVPWALPGLYNLYNQLAAMALAWHLGTDLAVVASALKDFRPAFGRMERAMVSGKEVWIALVKNPTGFNQVLATLAEEETPQAEPRAVGLIAINDDYADGRDVSWLWDVDFERWLPEVAVSRWWVSGRRAWDMAVRMKYAGWAPDQLHVEPDLARALSEAVAAAPERVFVLPTYTAMLSLRRKLTDIGAVRHFREG